MAITIRCFVIIFWIVLRISLYPISPLYGQINTKKVTANETGLLVFRLDALALSVIATATWLGGWLSHSGIVSKPLNLSENFFDHLKAPSL